ncbi:hypothetical protein Y032_0192g1378 [Ancylostoma ceylanicum]|uniref:Uncharacterized protein n=1 Tax=Ancylostoma ceylanicum TaxID=53326 RepID=A0A016SPL6_9BILA|nr:hypothetical protein Y032_0192g1378 [Ancylostoma ceylanicum]
MEFLEIHDGLFGFSGNSAETASNESERLMESDDDGNIQIEVPAGPPRSRMGRRFTLNPLIFAKEEREARRQSLAQLKLSYYPKHMNRECSFFST